MTSFLQPQNYVVAGASCQYSMQLVDLNGTAIGSDVVDGLTLSVIDKASGAVVNAVNLVHILNTGRGTLDLAGNCVIILEPADTALHISTDSFEVRSLVIDWTFGTKTGRHIVDIGIVAAPGTQPD